MPQNKTQTTQAPAATRRQNDQEGHLQEAEKPFVLCPVPCALCPVPSVLCPLPWRGHLGSYCMGAYSMGG
jgi:hypothetical protein